MNLKIDVLIVVIISSERLSKTVRGYISLGRANVFTTVTFPINVSFLWFHRFRQLEKSLSFGIRLFSSNLDFSLENTIPNVSPTLKSTRISNVLRMFAANEKVFKLFF